MGIENSMEQDSNRNADSGPGMARVQKLEKNISTGSPVFRALGQ